MRYQMFQQFQVSQLVPLSSTTTLVQTGNSTICLTSTAPCTWIVDSAAYDHMTGNKCSSHLAFNIIALSYNISRWFYILWQRCKRY